MRIHIDIYSETIVIEVVQDVHPRSIAVLCAGLKKYQASQIQTIYADFTHAQVTEEARQVILKLKEIQVGKAPQTADPLILHVPSARLIFAGKDSKFCDYLTLEAALTHHQTKESLQIIEKLRLQKELDTLTLRKNALSETLLTPEQKAAGNLSLFKLNASIQRIFKFLSSEVARKVKRVEKLRKSPTPEPEILESAQASQAKLTAHLEKLGFNGS